jgi:HD-GYP domain-containing protein (c-di-GMP phosphodiesterase class II)
MSGNDYVSRKEYNHLLHVQEAMYGRLLATIASIVSLRDEGTGGHCERVAHNATVLAKTLAHANERKQEGGESESMRQDIEANFNSIYWAGILHDLGKVAISDEILNKPGKLDPLEWEIMRQHADIGADCLQGIAPEFDVIAVGVRYHHERWEGEGYPEGLEGTHIPFSARCIAVADVFEAMTTRRSYHAPMREQDAITHLVSLSGSHLWPEAVDAFVVLWEERQVYTSRNRFIPPMMGPSFS